MKTRLEDALGIQLEHIPHPKDFDLRIDEAVKAFMTGVDEILEAEEWEYSIPDFFFQDPPTWTRLLS